MALGCFDAAAGEFCYVLFTAGIAILLSRMNAVLNPEVDKFARVVKTAGIKPEN